MVIKSTSLQYACNICYLNDILHQRGYIFCIYLVCILIILYCYLQIGLVSNHYTIRDVDLNDRRRFRGSKNIETIARQHGLWPPLDSEDEGTYLTCYNYHGFKLISFVFVYH